MQKIARNFLHILPSLPLVKIEAVTRFTDSREGPGEC
jgi:hypothetical protein